MLAGQSSQDEVEQLVENKINISFKTFKANDIIEESVVKKFIPFEGTSESSNAGTNDVNV